MRAIKINVVLTSITSLRRMITASRPISHAQSCVPSSIPSQVQSQRNYVLGQATRP